MKFEVKIDPEVYKALDEQFAAIRHRWSSTPRYTSRAFMPDYDLEALRKRVPDAGEEYQIIEIDTTLGKTRLIRVTNAARVEQQERAPLNEIDEAVERFIKEMGFVQFKIAAHPELVYLRRLVVAGTGVRIIHPDIRSSAVNYSTIPRY